MQLQPFHNSAQNKYQHATSIKTELKPQNLFLALNCALISNFLQDFFFHNLFKIYDQIDIIANRDLSTKANS